MNINSISERYGISKNKIAEEMKQQGHITSLVQARMTEAKTHEQLLSSGLSIGQISIINAVVTQKMSNINYLHFSRKESTIEHEGEMKAVPFSITKSGKDIFIHHKKLGSGATKTAKSIISFQTGKVFARITLNKTDDGGTAKDMAQSKESVERERELYGITKGMEGVTQAHMVKDFKKSKNGQVKEGYILEYMPSDLKAIAKNREIPVKHKLGMFRQAMIGVNNLHKAGIIHRDIKPANILTNYDPNNPKAASATKVSDLDLAVVDPNKQKGLKKQLVFREEIGLESPGSPLYMSEVGRDPFKRHDCVYDKVREADNTKTDPELRKEIVEKEDVYNAGVTLQELFFGSAESVGGKVNMTYSENGKTKKATMNQSVVRTPYCMLSKEQKLNQPPPTPTPEKLPVQVKELNALINRMLDPDPWKRPTMEEVIQATEKLEGLMDDSFKAGLA